MIWNEAAWVAEAIRQARPKGQQEAKIREALETIRQLLRDTP